jgi:hypothetical protein
MLKAMVNHKLSADQENMEDILTSNVFGSLEMCEADRLLFDFLRQARTLNGESLFAGASSIAAVAYRFWPRYQDCDEAFFREPDLELNVVLNDKREFAVVVEAKFLSGKSSFDDGDETREGNDDEPSAVPEIRKSNDQLASQWAHLVKSVAGTDRQPALIFLTADTKAPKAAIEESRAAARGTAAAEFECYWLSWRHLFAVLKPDGSRLERDLRAMLDYLDLHFFEGFHWPAFPETLDWKFLTKSAGANSLPSEAQPTLSIGMAPVSQPMWGFKA